MNRDEFYQRNFFTAIVNALGTGGTAEQNANIILTHANFPAMHMPTYPEHGNSVPFWSAIANSIEQGVGSSFGELVEGFESLYPKNPTVLAYRAFQSQQISATATANTSSPVATRPQSHVTVLLRNLNTVAPQGLLDLARRVVSTMQRDIGSVQLGFASREGLALQLTDWSVEDAYSFAQQLLQQPELAGLGGEQSVASSPYRDYLLSRIFVEGPDQAQMEITDIQGSTKIGEIAGAVIDQEYSASPSSGGMANPSARNVVVDEQLPDGTTRRLNPENTLHEEGIAEDAMLGVHPESRAGNLHPSIRDAALARVKGQVLGFAQGHEGIQFQVDYFPSQSPMPFEYVLRFCVPSFGPPEILGTPPSAIHLHEVFIRLPPDFPMKAPEVFWQTPIYHPNIHPTLGYVCLGELADRYLPSLDFGRLCQLLIEIASYQNYAVEAGHNLNAQRWASTPEGMLAIEQIGGISLFRQRLQSEFSRPRALWIKRVQS